MGTTISLHLHLPDDHSDTSVDASVRRFTDEIDRLEDLFSTYRHDSEVSRISRGELHLLDASPEVVEVLDACTWLEHASEGAFRARRPDEPSVIDPAGFVKGWAVERAARLLLDDGMIDWMISAGGDVLVHGTPSDADTWHIAIVDPDRADRALLAVSIPSGAVATSGTSQRGDHIWDGRNGAPTVLLRSATVIGPTLTWSDAIATTVMAMGVEGVAWASRFDDHRVLAIDLDGRVLASSDVVIDGLTDPAD